MPKWVSVLLGASVLLLAGWIAQKSYVPTKHRPQILLGDAGLAPLQLSLDASFDADFFGDGGLLLSDLLGPEARGDGGFGPFGKMPDGTTVPPLPQTAPRQVRFGVILVTYATAQASATGLLPKARTKDEAKALAESIAKEAPNDFKAAVSKGDPGSTEDAGRIKQGVLEPFPEYVLFSLAPGETGGPVDTPRGFWIVKRIE